MNIVVVGLGKFGREVIKYLTKEGHDLIVIDTNEETLEETVNEYDVKGFLGSGVNYDTLNNASIANYDLFIATTSSDEINILSCLIAKKIGVKNTVARIRNPEYNHLKISKDFGIDLTINPDLIAAKEIYNILRFPSALKVEEFSHGKVELVEYKVDNDSLIANKSLSSIQEEYNVRLLVCVVKREKDIIIPKGNFVIKGGDSIYIASNNLDLAKIFRKLNMFKARSKSVMLIGGGRTSYYLAQLLSNSNMNVKIIEKNKEEAKKLAEALPKALILNADGTDQQLLIEEGLEENSLVTLTGFDETNIVISSYAKSMNAKKVITKVSSSNYGSMLDSIGLDSVVSPKEVFATLVIRYIRTLGKERSSKCKALYRLVDNKVEALEFVINNDADYTNTPIKNLKIKKEYLIAAIIRDSLTILPGGNDLLKKDDSVIIVTTKPNTKDLSEIVE